MAQSMEITKMKTLVRCAICRKEVEITNFYTGSVDELIIEVKPCSECREMYLNEGYEEGLKITETEKEHP